MNVDDIFIFAGEVSADMHGGNLLKQLKPHNKKSRFWGVGGPDMRAQGLTGKYSIKDFNVMGFSDVLKSLPRLTKQFYDIRKAILESNPKAAIFIDSPSFSLRMARSLRKKGYKGKIIQYICPTIWAWGKQRVNEMAASFDLLLTIYPFEQKFFEKTSLLVNYIGNPLSESIRNHGYNPNWKQKFNIDENAPLIAIFPGSRTGEIQRNLPDQIIAARMIQNEFSDQKFGLAISCAQDLNHDLIKQLIHKENIPKENFYLIPKEFSYELMRSAKCAIAKSGTVTLELALHECPTVITYKLTTLNKWIAQYILKVNLPHYCIVNILANRTVYPELITLGSLPNNIYDKLKPFCVDSPLRQECVKECQKIQKMFDGDHSSEKAAKAIVELLQ